MRELFSLEGPFFNFMNKIADLLLLNIIWVICCIPIITAGASTTAMYYVALKIVKNEESYIFKGFFHSFKENFKQATIIWVIAILMGAFLSFDIYICRQGAIPGSQVLVYILSVLYVIYVMTLSFVFPVLARFQTTTKNIIKNSFLMCIGHLPYTVLIMLMSFGPVVIMLLSPHYMMIGISLYVLCAGGLIAAVNSMLFVKIFKKYMPKEEPSEQDIEE